MSWVACCAIAAFWVLLSVLKVSDHPDAALVCSMNGVVFALSAIAARGRDQ